MGLAWFNRGKGNLPLGLAWFNREEKNLPWDPKLLFSLKIRSTVRVTNPRYFLQMVVFNLRYNTITRNKTEFRDDYHNLQQDA